MSGQVNLDFGELKIISAQRQFVRLLILEVKMRLPVTGLTVGFKL